MVIRASPSEIADSSINGLDCILLSDGTVRLGLSQRDEERGHSSARFRGTLKQYDGRRMSCGSFARLQQA